MTDGQEGLEFLHWQDKYLRALRPDLIRLDLGLPKIDSREALANIKADAELRTIPVVILTVSTSYEGRIESEPFEVDAYLTDPVNLAKFLAVVRELKHYWHEDMVLPAAGWSITSRPVASLDRHRAAHPSSVCYACNSLPLRAHL